MTKIFIPDVQYPVSDDTSQYGRYGYVSSVNYISFSTDRREADESSIPDIPDRLSVYRLHIYLLKLDRCFLPFFICFCRYAIARNVFGHCVSFLYSLYVEGDISGLLLRERKAFKGVFFNMIVSL